MGLYYRVPLSEKETPKGPVPTVPALIRAPLPHGLSPSSTPLHGRSLWNTPSMSYLARVFRGLSFSL